MRELQTVLALLLLLAGAVLAMQMVTQGRRVLRIGPVQQMESDTVSPVEEAEE
jgi:hypothetical protein